MKTILITGSRDWLDEDLIRERLSQFRGRNLLITGACPTGADRMAEKYAEDMDWEIAYFPADWSRYGRRAGYIRNKMMVDSRPDHVLAFIRNGSRGATMTYEMAVKAGLDVEKHVAS